MGVIRSSRTIPLVSTFLTPTAAAPAALLLDTVTGAEVAYSVRKLRAAYAGSAIRVRRSSDDAETDIGFSSNSLDESALTTHVGANNGFVVTWYDQSGNGNNATQATAALQPIIVASGTINKKNTRPVFDFAAANTNLATISNVGNFRTAAAIGSITGGSFAFDGLFTEDNDAGQSISVVFASDSGSDFTNGIFRTSDGETFNVNNVSTLTAVFSGTLFQVSGHQNSDVSWSNSGMIGRDRGYSGREWDGMIGEVVAWVAEKTGSTFTDIYTDQKTYWGTP